MWGVVFELFSWFSLPGRTCPGQSYARTCFTHDTAVYMYIQYTVYTPNSDLQCLCNPALATGPPPSKRTSQQKQENTFNLIIAKNSHHMVWMVFDPLMVNFGKLFVRGLSTIVWVVLETELWVFQVGKSHCLQTLS